MNDTTQPTHISLVNELGEDNLRKQVGDSFNLQRSVDNAKEILNRFEHLPLYQRDFILSVSARIMIPARQPATTSGGLTQLDDATARAMTSAAMKEHLPDIELAVFSGVQRGYIAGVGSRPAFPITQGVQLTEEETDRLASIAYEAWKESPVGADAFVPVVKAVLSERLSVPATPLVMDCVWSEDPDGAWKTQCGHNFEFNDDGPTENKFTHCAYCGGHLIPAPVPPVSEEDAAAFSAKMAAVQQLRLKHGVISDALPEMWDTARAYFESKKDSGK